MADPRPLAEKLATVLPFVLPIVGGLCGVAIVNAMGDGNPVFGIGGGALAGWAVSAVVVRLLDRV